MGDIPAAFLNDAIVHYFALVLFFLQLRKEAAPF
jgi:hypothetical protein